MLHFPASLQGLLHTIVAGQLRLLPLADMDVKIARHLLTCSSFPELPVWGVMLHIYNTDLACHPTGHLRFCSFAYQELHLTALQEVLDAMNTIRSDGEEMESRQPSLSIMHVMTKLRSRTDVSASRCCSICTLF